jgi:hypothetical protein
MGVAAEVSGIAHPEDSDDDVAEPPGDRGGRRPDGFRVRPVDQQCIGAGRHGGGGGTARAHSPGSRNGLPEVLLVGQSLEPRSELMLPVPLELIT